MEIILFKNGTGTCRTETALIHGDKILFKFIGAPEYSVATFIGEKYSTRHTLFSNSQCEIDISQLLGDVKITLSHKGKIWYCDGIHVEKDTLGDIRIYSLANYPEKFGYLLNEIEKLKGDLSIADQAIKRLTSSLEEHKEKYELI